MCLCNYRRFIDTMTWRLIIIIMSCGQYGYPWPFLSTSPYHSSLLAGLQRYIPYHHIAAVCMFELVVLLLIGHMWGSTGVPHLWARRLHKKKAKKIITQWPQTTQTKKDQQNNNKVKILYGFSKRQRNKISHEKTWTRLRKGTLKKEVNLF